MQIPVAGCVIYSEYWEYTAHGDVLRSIDYDLSESWMSLRTAFVVLASIMLGCLFLIPITSSTQALFIAFMVLSGLGLFVVEILKIVKLYKMYSCMTYHSYE